MTRPAQVVIGLLWLSIVALAFCAGRASATSRPAVHDIPTAGPLSESDLGRRTRRPMTLEQVPLATLPAEPAARGLGVRSGGRPPYPTVVVPLPRLSGLASWYAWRPGQAAAGPALRAFLGPNWRGRIVTVCAAVCIRVSLTDWCGCPGGRVIDLDSRSFARLAPLSAGLVAVRVTT